MAINWPISPAKLRRLGVVGMNQRNGSYIAPLNERRRYPLVDDKLQTKALANQFGLAVPELYGEIRTPHDIRRLAEIVAGHEDFVIKPAHGAGGDGILVIDGKQGQMYRRASGRLISLDDLSLHISNILAGAYSLGGRPDTAMIEYRVKFSPLFIAVSYQGVPDIRTIVYRGFPVMAMVRLPTMQSDGKANLHQGAIGAGIDLGTGHTLDGVGHNLRVTHHPDTLQPIAGLPIPEWDKLMTLAATSHDMTGLGYLGVDVVLDHELGPLILELNARPGLSIQIANGTGLGHRLTAVDRHIEELERSGQPAPDAVTRARWSQVHLGLDTSPSEPSLSVG